MTNPAIIVPAFNRPNSLRRLLKSLSMADYPSGGICLVISVDLSEFQSEVKRVASEFDWRFGKKEIITHNEHKGLRRHVIFCGDLVASYNGIILLEDDLFVSPQFYSYALEASETYSDDHRIAGISLYAHSYNETAMLAFLAYEDGYSNFFLQLPSSWGQYWSPDQWGLFRRWYDEHQSVREGGDNILPPDVVKWPESSWKKYFIRYMISSDKYFVYPRMSLTTNFMDPGTHHKATYNHLQVPLQNVSAQYNFSTIEDSLAVYDAYCEPIPATLEKLSSSLAAFSGNYAVDLYGTKPLDQQAERYIVTSRPCRDPLLSWGRRLKPHESNLFLDIEGGDIRLGNVADCASQLERGFFTFANFYHSLSPQFHLYGSERSETLSTKESITALAACEEYLDAVLNSTSWKMTRPLRSISSYIRDKL